MSEGRRFTRKDWLEAGIRALAQQGHEGLRVASLAKSLGVTKGSFYWHFDNVGGFHDALLEHWHRHYVSVAPRDAREGVAPPLKALVGILQDRRLPAIDVAIRRWATVNAKAREAIAHSERYRTLWLIEMMCKQGVERKTAEARAQLVIWAVAGSAGEPNQRWRMKVLGELFALIAKVE